MQPTLSRRSAPKILFDSGGVSGHTELHLMAQAEELAVLVTALERDLSAFIQSEYAALL
jgi:hypothetical protein